MKRIEKTVFISYRRTNASWALAVFQNLTQHGYDVFFDYSGIASGDFESVILANIKARAHFVVLLTPSALEHSGDPADWLRREIEAALGFKRNIVPLMLEGFDFKTPRIANQLTGTLAALKSYNALRVPVEYFEEAMGRLREKFLSVPLDAVLHAPSLSARQAAKRQQAAAVNAPVVPEEDLTATEWFERALNTDDLDENVRFYSEAIRLNPAFAPAFNNRGSSRSQQGDVVGAMKDYDEAIRLNPNVAAFFANRGLLRREQGDLKGALQDLTRAIGLDPNNGDNYRYRGNLHREQSDLEGALQDYSEAIRLNPDDATAYDFRGAVRREENDLDGSLEDYNELVRLEPENFGTYNNRALTRWSNDDLEGALQDFGEAIRLKPDYPYTYDNRGNLRTQTGDLEGALQDYSEAIRLTPLTEVAYLAEFYKHRSKAREAKGDLKGAGKDYNEAIRLNPELKK